MSPDTSSTTLVPPPRAVAPPPPPPAPPAPGATVPLVRSFRFLHEPVIPESAARFVGRDGELAGFVERLIFSNGGSFLVTGYRGVGKTSFINLALKRLDDAVRAAEPVLGVRTRVVPISLNVARPVQPSELMHYIVRRLYERLVEMGIYPLLDAETREALRRAYDRTSFNMVRKLGESTERSYGVGEAGLSSSVLGAAAKLSWSEKRSRSQNYEMTFLGYDDRAAEHDIITIARALCAGYVEPMSLPQRVVRWLTRAPKDSLPRTALKIVFVFDELDKLEEYTVGKGNQKKPVIDDILGSLKNLFTTSGVTFVFVAGKDLQERWLEDVGKGDSVYESVFSFDRYLPCLWGDTFSICDQLVDATALRQGRIFDRFKGFLAYKGRGIPRRIVRTFNEYVSWRDNQPMLVFTRQQLNRITFFAGLNTALERHAATLFGESREEVAGTQSDKRRLGVYYLVDWMMRQGRPFTLSDVANASRRLSAKIALADEIAPRVIEDVITALVEGEYLREVTAKLDEAVIATPGAVVEKRWEVPPRRVIEMGGAGSELEEDAQLLGAITSPEAAEARVTSFGTYRVVGPIGEGGMGDVFRATDDGRRVVAIKTVRRELLTNPDVLRRFAREAEVMRRLSHPNLVRFIEFGAAEGRPYIVMEFLDGVTLDRVLDAMPRLELPAIVRIAQQVADGMQYLHQQGIVRNDLKPSNVMIQPSGRVCLLDFGISKFAHEIEEPSGDAGDLHSGDPNVTGEGFFVGTPRYMAPELVESKPADARSDVYSLGVLLYQMLTRNLPFDAENPAQIFILQRTETPKPPSSYVELPRAIDEVVLRCLSIDPAGRYPSMAALADSLESAAGSLPPADLGPLVALARERERWAESLAREDTVVGEHTGEFAPAAPPLPVQVPMERPAAAQPVPAPAFPQAVDSTYPPTRAPAPPPAVAPPASPRPSIETTAERLAAGAPGHAYIAPVSMPYECEIALPRSDAGFELKRRETTFGRARENDIVLRGPMISRYHGRFVTAPDGATQVEAFGTTNGVRVNGVRVEGQRTLRDGDEIDVAGFRFAFAEVGIAAV